MIDITEPDSHYEHVIHYDEAKNEQVRLTVNTFRGIEYLHIRKYYLDFDESWKPTPTGIALPLDFNNSKELFRALTEILSLAESRQVIEETFGDLIRELYPEYSPNTS
tara:strand:+ start:1184 stop:1507 length:324 start_codon:yes stop_codon:yes gene_type:complete